jgi:predicted DNA-binding protein (UPF0251 family)
MTEVVHGFVLFGDVVRSRRDPPTSTDWLRALEADLDGAYAPEERLAPFGFTQGDELQGLLRLTADPFRAVLRASLHPAARPMRWAIVAGPVDPGEGPATQRTGEAFLAARSLLEVTKARRDRLSIAVGDPSADALLADLAPLLADLLGELTERQREVARLLLVEGLRRSEAAEVLDVSRATISVVADRARVRGIERLTDALRRIIRDGVETAFADSGAR